MAGEKVLLIDSSAAVQEMGQTALEEAGFRVAIGSNGASVLTAPDLKELDVIILDVATEGIDGFLATRELKTDAETHVIPILLLIPEEEAETRGSQGLRGANGFLVKPFAPGALVERVKGLIEERVMKAQCDQFLRDSASAFMEQLAEDHIRSAVEDKTQILVERAIQAVITELDQRISREVNERMTTLSAEREQELVRATVHEVAQSMVEKLAERKVSEVIENVLVEKTEAAVRNVAEKSIPTVARKQIKDSLEHILPREVGGQVQRAMENIVPDVTKKIVLTIDGIAQKVVPKAAREKLPELTERHIKATTDKVLPDMVRDLVAHELVRQFNDHIDPQVREVASRINRKIGWMMIVAFLLMVFGVAACVAAAIMMGGSGG